MIEKKINESIVAKSVVLIGVDNVKIGEVDLKTALRIADDNEMDLVQMNDEDVPVCKILNYSKMLYEQKKAMKQNKTHKTETKELGFRPNIFINDLLRLIKKAQECVDDGDNVKFTVKLKGRELNNINNVVKSFDLIESSVKLPKGYSFKRDNISDGKMIFTISK